LIVQVTVGASHSKVHTITKEHFSTDNPSIYYVTTVNSISFDFYEPSIPSPYAVPPGVSLEETTHALLVGEWPMTTSTPSHSTGSPSESKAAPSTTFAEDGSFHSSSSLDATHPIEGVNVANPGMNSLEAVLHSHDEIQAPTLFK
jgi:hypothetical protein